MATYFHGSSAVFAPGDIIKAGRFGSRFSRFLFPQGEHLFETTCEQVRSTYFSQKPSRLMCVFTCANLAGLQEFCSRYPGRSHFYEVEPVDKDAAIHVSSWNLLYGNELFGMVNCSWVYWTIAPTENIEVIIGCDVKVVRKIQ